MAATRPRSITFRLHQGGRPHRIKEAENIKGARLGPASDERERIEALEREVRELRQANEILRKACPEPVKGASAYFAMAELDRKSRT